MFATPKDYQAFENIMAEAKEKVPMNIISYKLMPNHWHMELRPDKDDALPKFMHWLTNTHTRRWHEYMDNTGTGHLYQGRYKSFPVTNDTYFLQVTKYIEQNAFRAGLVERPELWRWSSAWRRIYGSEEDKKLLSDWPVEPPRDYIAWLNDTLANDTLNQIRSNLQPKQRGRPKKGRSLFQ